MAKRTLSWWYWLGTVGLPAIGLFGDGRGLAGAITLTGNQTGHVAVREGSLRSFLLQVRWAYLSLLRIGLWPPLAFVQWGQLVGTSAVVTFDDGLLARLLSLWPWNRREPLTFDLFRRRIFSPPVQGSIPCETKRPLQAERVRPEFGPTAH